MKQLKQFKIIHLILFTGFLFLGTGLTALCFSRMIYPYDTGNLEALNWLPASLTINGRNPFAYAEQPPFVMAPYGYVFYSLLGVGIKIFGLQLWFGRGLTILAFLLAVFSVGQITRAVTNDRTAAKIAQLSCLAFFPLQFWIASQRSDLIAAAFALFGLSLIFYSRKNTENFFVNVVLPVFFLNAAFFTKQTFIIAIGIAPLVYLQKKNYRYALCFLLGAASVWIAGNFILDATSDGGYLWQHLTHAEGLPLDSVNFFSISFVILTMPATAAFLFLILSAGFFFLYENKAQPNRLSLSYVRTKFSSEDTGLSAILYFLLCFGFAFFSTWREGASTNYYIEPFLAAALVVGMICKKLLHEQKPKLVAAFLIILVLSGCFQLFRIGRGEYFRWQGLLYYNEIVATLDKSTPKSSICVSLYPELVTATGRSFYFDDLGEYTADWADPKLKKVFAEELSKKRIAAIIWNDDRAEEYFPGFRLVKMKQPPPQNFWAVYLYVREDLYEK